MTEVLAPHTPFQLMLNSVGVFPNTKNPRVLWVGLKDNGDILQQLQVGIETAMQSAGFPLESKSFLPHLTLARIKSPKGKKALQAELDALNQKGINPHPFDVGAIQLYESQLTPKGSIYTVLANFKLNP